MSEKAPLWALDFDGVICDSAIETGLSGWAVATEYWPEMPRQCPDEMLSGFREVRPVMETGFEAILIMRLLYEGKSSECLLTDFSSQLDSLMQREQLFSHDLKAQFGHYRDRWIESDLDSWINNNPLFDGIKSRLQTFSADDWLIITTKQQRFVEYILQANAIQAPSAIYGLEDGRSKPVILKDLYQSAPAQPVIFVEDRLPTLIKVMQEDCLQDMALWLADWGYNTDQDKAAAQASDRLQLKSLDALLV